MLGSYEIALFACAGVSFLLATISLAIQKPHKNSDKKKKGHALKKITVHAENPINDEHLQRLRDALRDGPVLITTHDNPDPDALASGKAINYLINSVWGIPTRLIYTGQVGRAENQAMFRWLTPEWEQHPDGMDLSKFSCVVFIDCQPGSRILIPVDDNLPKVVIDHHHPILEQTQDAIYADVRPNVGATVTMIYQYLDAAQATIDTDLATAMFIGLKADTNDLSGNTTLEDGIVYVKLLEKLNRQLFLKIKTAGLSQEYYQALFRGIQNARVYGKVVVATLGEMHRPDLAAELADLLFRYEQVNAALCSGIYNQEIRFSIRTNSLEQDAGSLIQNVIFPPGTAGGHGVMAGGQIPLDEHEDSQPLIEKLEGLFLANVGEAAGSKPQPLL